MINQSAKKLFVDYINYMVDWFNNGIYADNPDVVVVLNDVLRQVTDGSLDWAFDMDNLYEDDEHPEYIEYENRLPLFCETIHNLKGIESLNEKNYNKSLKEITTEEELENYLSGYHSVRNHLGQLIYAYELVSDFHDCLFYSRY